MSLVKFLNRLQGVPKQLWPVCGACGGAVDSVVSVFTQLHISSCNLEFETLFELI